MDGESYLHLVDEVRSQLSKEKGVMSFSDISRESYLKTDEFASDYNPDITKERWAELLSDKNVFDEDDVLLMRRIMELGGEASCTEIAERYGGEWESYNAIAIKLSKKIHAATHCKLHKTGKKTHYWPIMFRARNARADEGGKYIWIIRNELSDALKESGILSEPDHTVKKEEPCIYGLNTIFYGPPGTGKTYRTMRAAVEIIDGSSDDDFEEVRRRYDELFEEGRIRFVTFHQSYGYEEFIEGIRPVMDSDDDSGDIRYDVIDGAFKRFCNRSAAPILKNIGIRDDPTIWKVSLNGTGDNEIRTECLEYGHIRIGFDEHGPEINDFTSSFRGRNVLNQFMNGMQIGDIVVSCYSSTETDAIGVVTGDYEWHDEYDTHTRVRKVRWIRKFSKGEMPDITAINSGKQLTLSTVYRLKITLADVMRLAGDIGPEPEKGNYVFIIDEINRGNISRIFGELITLIEPTKRAGAPESPEAILPYSGQRFSVPDNVYIVGTMNTADRSLVSMDTALRRRFDFIEVMPDPSVVEGNPGGVDLGLLLKTINNRIEALYDREHTIGHSYFMKVRSIGDLKDVFRFNIIPLLVDYFHEDYEKVRLVLSTMDDCNRSPFIEETDRSEWFGNYSDGDLVTYSVNEDNLDDAGSYISLYKKSS